MSISVKQYANVGSLQTFLLAILFGLGIFALATGASPSMLVILAISVIVMVIRHLGDWIVPLLGAICGILLAVLFGINLPEQALLIVVFGSVWF